MEDETDGEMDGQTMTQTLAALPNDYGWDALESAIFGGAVKADQSTGCERDEDVRWWAERHAARTLEDIADQIAETAFAKSVDRDALRRAERVISHVTFATWQDVRRHDYHAGREQRLRSLMEVAGTVAATLGIALPENFQMDHLDHDRARALPLPE